MVNQLNFSGVVVVKEDLLLIGFSILHDNIGPWGVDQFALWKDRAKGIGLA
jgi:hypothetical protein